MAIMIKRLAKTTGLILFLFAFLSVPVLADNETIEVYQFHLNSEDSDYVILIPNYIVLDTVEVYDEYDEETYKKTVVVAHLPERDSEGNSFVFQIETTDGSATFLDSYPGNIYGQLGNVAGNFVDGKFDYVVDFELKEYEVYTFDFFTDSGFIVENLNFMFISKDIDVVDYLLGNTDTDLEDDVTAVPTSSTVLVNGEEVAFDAYLINNNNYFKLRDLGAVVSGTEKQFEISWDGETNSIVLESGQAYTAVGGELELSDSRTEQQVKGTSSTIYVDGEETAFTAYNINGNNYFKLRDIAQTFNIGVSWDGERNTIIIDTSVDYVEE